MVQSEPAMMVYQLPSQIRGLIFDMDLTLYQNKAYYRSQIKNQIVLLSSDLGMEIEALRQRLDEWQTRYRRDHGDRRPSFGNTLLGALEYPIEKSVELRKRAIRPEDYLSADPRLQETLALLEKSFRLVLLTNNPVEVAERTLRVLGVRGFFPNLIGLDTVGHSKPHPAAFELAYQRLNLPESQVVSIGDRVAVDLEVPLERGSGAILVETMDDVYDLPRVLTAGKS